MLYVVIIRYACYCKICIVGLYHRPNYLKLDILNTPLFFVSNIHALIYRIKKHLQFKTFSPSAQIGYLK